MSAVSCLLSEDQFLCSICLDVFTDPVSIPCGHNFCKSCITKHWELGLACMCPNCKKVFSTRPELHVNTFISEMAAQFNQSAQQTASSSSSCSCSSSGQQAAKPGEVPCDVCTGTKVKALKSCLACLVSYCETHLEPHLKLSGLEKHQLINPVKNLEGRMCTKHDKLLELFCSKDQACICTLCTLLDHKGHEVVPLKEEFERKLMKTEADLQMMIEVRRVKIQQIKRSVEVSRRIADQEIAGCIQVFTMMKEAIEKKQAEVIRMIQESHKRKKSCVDDFIMGLNVEISNMKRRSAELEQLSKSDDHLNLLQNFPSVEAFKNCKWVIVLPPSYELSVRTAVTQLMEKLNKETEKLFPREDGTRTLLSHKQGCRQDISSS